MQEANVRKQEPGPSADVPANIPTGRRQGPQRREPRASVLCAPKAPSRGRRRPLGPPASPRGALCMATPGNWAPKGSPWQRQTYFSPHLLSARSEARTRQM